MRETTGHVLPRDIFPSSLTVGKVTVKAESAEKDEMDFLIGYKRVGGGEKVEEDFGTAYGSKQTCYSKRLKMGDAGHQNVAEVPVRFPYPINDYLLKPFTVALNN